MFRRSGGRGAHRRARGSTPMVELYPENGQDVTSAGMLSCPNQTEEEAHLHRAAAPRGGRSDSLAELYCVEGKPQRVSPSLHRWMEVDSGDLQVSQLARSGQTICVAGSQAIMVGGCGSRGCLSDMHSLDLNTLRWRQLDPRNASSSPTEAPSARTCHAMSSDDRHLYLSGGASDDPDDLQADLWQYDIRTRVWQRLFKAEKEEERGRRGGREGDQQEQQRIGTYACSRIGHTMLHTSSSIAGAGGGGRRRREGTSSKGCLVFFGGSTGFEYFNEVIVFDLESQRFTLLPTTGTKPSPRYKQQALIESGRNFIVLGGGAFEPTEGAMQVFSLDLVTLEWSVLSCSGTKPPERTAHSIAFDPQSRRVFVTGGFSREMRLDRHCYALKLDSREWVELGAAAERGESGGGVGGDGGAGGRRKEASSGEKELDKAFPPARSFHSSFFFRGRLFLVGGSNGIEKLGDIWNFRLKENIPTLAALAARVLFAGDPSGREGTGKGGKGGKDGKSGKGDKDGKRAALIREGLLQRLPREVSDAVRGMNVLADALF